MRHSPAAATVSRAPRRRLGGVAIALLVALVALVAGLPAAQVWAIEPSESVQRALQQMEAKRYSLARSYLDPVVIDPRLTATQRARAYYLRGRAFLDDGLYVSAAQDYTRALELDPDNPTVLAELGRLYAEGIGVEKSSDKAFTLLQKAARGGNDIARVYVGYALLTGAGTAQDVDKARYWLREAADAGHVDALVQLARSYRAPYSNPPDIERALTLYREAIDKGSVDALVALGYMHVEREIGKPDLPRATEYFRQAAERGSGAGQTALGFVYLGEHRYADARQWFERATAAGYADAFAGLGRIYQNGFGVTANRSRALELFSKGAALGDVQSQLILASLELEAPATLARTQQALHWLRLAAQRDHAQGHNGLAWVLSTTRFDELRDGPAALTAAQRATELARSANTLDTLAAAYAETGDFDRAVVTQREALAIIDAEHAPRRAEFERHLDSYLQRKPWRE